MVIAVAVEHHARQPDAQAAADRVERRDGAEDLARIGDAKVVDGLQLDHGVQAAPAKTRDDNAIPHQVAVKARQQQQAGQHDDDVGDKYQLGPQHVGQEAEQEFAEQAQAEQQAQRRAGRLRIEAHVAHVQEQVRSHRQDRIEGGHGDKGQGPETAGPERHRIRHVVLRGARGAIRGAAGAQRLQALFLGTAGQQQHQHQQHDGKAGHQLEAAAPAICIDQAQREWRKYHASQAAAHQRDADGAAAQAHEPLRHHDHRDVDAGAYQHHAEAGVDQVHLRQAVDMPIRVIQGGEQHAARQQQAAHADAVDQHAGERRQHAGREQGDQVAQLELAAAPAELLEQRFIEGRDAGSGQAIRHQQHQQRQHGDNPRINPLDEGFLLLYYLSHLPYLVVRKKARLR